MEEAALARGVNALCGGVRCMALVSNVKEEGATFLEDWLPILKMDFHADWLGLVGERGWTGRA